MSRGAVRYHVPRERSPVPAVLVGALVLVTLVSAQLSIAGEPSRTASGTAAVASAPEPGPGAGEASAAPSASGTTAPSPAGQPGSAPPSPDAAPSEAPAPSEPDAQSPTSAPAPTASRPSAGATGDDEGLQPVEITFAVGQDAPSGDADALLGPVVEALLADPTTTVRVVGHAAPSNDPVLEEQLSLRRAETVLDLLVDRGLPAGRAEVVAAGASQAGTSLSGTDRRVTLEVVDG